MKKTALRDLHNSRRVDLRGKVLGKAEKAGMGNGEKYRKHEWREEARPER